MPRESSYRKLTQSWQRQQWQRRRRAWSPQHETKKIGEELQISYVLLLQTFGSSIKTHRFRNFLGGNYTAHCSLRWVMALWAHLITPRQEIQYVCTHCWQASQIYLTAVRPTFSSHGSGLDWRGFGWCGIQGWPSPIGLSESWDFCRGEAEGWMGGFGLLRRRRPKSFKAERTWAKHKRRIVLAILAVWGPFIKT